MILGGLFCILAVALVFFSGRIVFPLRYEAILAENANREKLDPHLLAAIVYTESKFSRGSRSPAGATGLMQLMPDTAAWAAAKIGRSGLERKLTVPKVNVRLGSYYFRFLLDKYKNERLALAAYNGGHRNLDAWIKRTGGRDVEGIIDKIPYPETREFVGRVERARLAYLVIYPNLGKSAVRGGRRSSN